MAMVSGMAVVTSTLFRPARCSTETPSPSTSAAPNSANSASSFKVPLSNTFRHLKVDADESASVGTGRQAILDPALQYANLMWFRGSYNAQIFVSEDEPADSVVRRFRKAVMQAGVIPECRRRRFFETPQEIAKRKLQAAQRRNKTRRFTPRPDTFTGEKKEGASSKKAADDDYWGYTDETS